MLSGIKLTPTGLSLMSRYQQAVALALEAHNGQFRKYNGLPYIVHPLQVAAFVGSFYSIHPDSDVSIASILHDVLEDCKPEYGEKILPLFGGEVYRLVVELTNTSKETGLNRYQRKIIDRERLRTVSEDAQRIKLVDRYLNLLDMEGAPKGFQRKYAEESKLLVEVIGEAGPGLAFTILALIDEMLA